MKVLFLLWFAASAFCPRLTIRRPAPFSIDTTFSQSKLQSNTKNLANVVNEYCIPLENISHADLPKVGGYVKEIQVVFFWNSILTLFGPPYLFFSKAASLGEMIQRLAPLGVAVPGGFAITAAAYEAVLDRFQLRERLRDLLQNVDGKKE